MSAEFDGTGETVRLLLKSIDDVESRIVAPNSVSVFRLEVSEALSNLTNSSIGGAIAGDKISAIRVTCETLARHLLMAAPSAEKTEDLKRAARDAAAKLG